MDVGISIRLLRVGIIFLSVAVLAVPLNKAVLAQSKELSDRGRAADRNKNGVIDRDEAGGPLKTNFDEMDCNKSGTLDGGEIRGFFTGEECPKQSASPAKLSPATVANSKAGVKATRGHRARAVRVDAVIVEPLSQTSPVIGRLVARRTGDVAARINGAVVSMPTSIGDRVKKGDVIAALSRERLTAARDKYLAALTKRRAMVQSAQAEYSKKKQILRRMADLRKSSAFSRARYEDLQRDVETGRAVLVERQSQLKEAQAELDQASIDLYNVEIRSPYDGVVSQRHTEIGAYVNVGTPVVTLISDTDIEVEAEVPSRQIIGLSSGTIVRFTLDDGTQHRARVRSIVPRENARTRTRPVRFVPEFGARKKPFAVNQSVTLLVPIGQVRQVLTVHKDAIVYSGDDKFVRIVRRGKAFPRKIEIGSAIGNRFVVTKGLKAEDQVVTYGNETLPPGVAVRVLTSSAPNVNIERGKTN